MAMRVEPIDFREEIDGRDIIAQVSSHAPQDVQILILVAIDNPSVMDRGKFNCYAIRRLTGWGLSRVRHAVWGLRWRMKLAAGKPQ